MTRLWMPALGAVLVVGALAAVPSTKAGNIEAESLYGIVAITTAEVEGGGEFRIGVAVDTSILGQDPPWADVVYGLQTRTDPGTLPEGLVPNIHVDFERGRVQLTRDGEPSPFLRLTLDAPEAVQRQGATTVVGGFGLSRSTGFADGTISEGRFSSDLLSWLTFICRTLDCEECSSGGPYSSACTISGCDGAPSGCSVTCNEPATACCCCLWMGGPAKCQCRA